MFMAICSKNIIFVLLYSSMLHYDADNILHCLVAGRKDWILIHPRYKVLSDMAQRDPGQVSWY